MLKLTTNNYFSYNNKLAHIFAEFEQSMIKIVDSSGIRFWSCIVCNKTAKRKADIRRHVETHYTHSEQNCSLCGKVAKNSEALRTHMKTYHKEI